MELDVEGKLRSTKLSFLHGLLPVYDAIMNSIQSLEESKITDKKIDVYIVRSNVENAVRPQNGPISCVKIVDNGIGFTEENYKSFRTSYSPHKLAKGCKGVGRFLWLKAFEKATISSIFEENGKKQKRTFDFTHSQHGIENHVCASSVEDQKTEIILSGFGTDYAKKNSFEDSSLASKIVEHFIDFFVNDIEIQFTLIDQEKSLNLNYLFKSYLKENSQTREIEINNNIFKIIHLKAYGKSFDQGQLSNNIGLCANKRTVSQYPLSEYVPFADIKLLDFNQSQNQFFSRTFVSGSYLDSIINTERTKLDFPEQQESLFSNFVREQELLEKISVVIKEILQPYVANVLLENRNNISIYIQNEAPEFRPLLKYVPNLEEKIRPELPKNQLDLELYKLHSKEVIETKKLAAEVLTKDTSDDYLVKLNQYLDRQNDFSRATLAQYVTHRRVILDLLQKKLGHDSQGNFSLEEAVHEIVFPLNQTSNDRDFERQNLWIIDERLAFHTSLASDKPLSQNQTIKLDSNLRPDILIFDNPFAFSESRYDHSSIVIIEFKRPGRALGPNEDDDPVKQVIRYITKIRDGKARTHDDLEFTVSSNIPFFCYIVCDLNVGKIRETIKNFHSFLRPNRGNDGYFGFQENLNAYIEIISFSKMLGDSVRRNTAIFKKLGLPG